MAVRIQGEVIDDLAKINSADIITQGSALVGEVMQGETFYAGSSILLTGTLPTVALAPGSSAYPQGYHVGDGGGLPAIDGDLVTANIKNGIIIFNVAGHVDVRNVSDANALVAEVKTGRTFYAVGGARKTGTMATVALAAGANAYPAGYHAGEASLTAVDGDLAAGNIKDGITIFGVLGTFTGGALAEDITGFGICALTGAGSYSSYDFYQVVGASADLDLATTTDVYDADSMAVAVGAAHLHTDQVDRHKLRVYMDGTLVAETGYVITATAATYVAVGTRALSGSKICKVADHNHGGASAIYMFGARPSGNIVGASIGVGSIKKT